MIKNKFLNTVNQILYTIFIGSMISGIIMGLAIRIDQETYNYSTTEIAVTILIDAISLLGIFCIDIFRTEFKSKK